MGPMPMVAPAMPPPPVLPASACHEHWDQHRAMGPLFPDQGFTNQGFTNYRERLRASGRGVFQRAIDAGFVPKSMKQDWGAGQISSAHAPGMLQQSPYGGQQMWNGASQMQSNDYCGMPMAQYSQDFCGVQMQAHQTPDLNQMRQMSRSRWDQGQYRCNRCPCSNRCCHRWLCSSPCSRCR